MIRTTGRSLIVLLLCAVQALAGTITGVIQTPTGGGVAGATMTFNLSQGAIMSGTASVVASQVSCYTSTNGNLVGVPDPQIAPVLATSTGSGTLPPGNYYVQLYYIGAGGVSLVSPEASINLSGTGEIQVSAPILQPGSATGYGIAVGATSGSETIQSTVTGWSNYYQASALVVGATPSTSNTSSCAIAFSDQLIPTGTFYNVNLVNKLGSQIAGFPQTWCLYGGANGTVNISGGAPVGNCGAFGVYYPTPLWSNPPSGAVTQSLNSGLNMGGNPLIVGNITSSGSLTLGSSLSVAGLTSTNGAVIDVSGSACSMPFQLVNVDASPTNPNKYFRVNQSTGALEIVNSACSATIFSLDDAGDITVTGNITGGSGGTIGTPLTLASNGLIGNPASPLTGNSISLTTPNGFSGSSSFGSGGKISLATGARCNNSACDSGPFAFGPLNSNTFANQWNGLALQGQGWPLEVARVDLTGQSATLGGGTSASSTLYAVPTYTSAAAPASQQYFLTWNTKVTTAASGGSPSSSIGPVTLKYTDPDGVAQTLTLGAITTAGAIATQTTGNTTTSVLNGVGIMLNCEAGTNITYGVTYSSTGTTPMQYNFHVNLLSF